MVMDNVHVLSRVHNIIHFLSLSVLDKSQQGEENSKYYWLSGTKPYAAIHVTSCETMYMIALVLALVQLQMYMYMYMHVMCMRQTYSSLLPW